MSLGSVDQISYANGRRAMPIKRMDNVLILVEDLEVTKTFFLDLGLTLEGEATVRGPEGIIVALAELTTA